MRQQPANIVIFVAIVVGALAVRTTKPLSRQHSFFGYIGQKAEQNPKMEFIPSTV